MKFQWTKEERESNYRKHGIDFVDAAKIFNCPVLKKVGERDLILAVGKVNRVFLFVVYIWREPVCRIISARMATEDEIQKYKLILRRSKSSLTNWEEVRGMTSERIEELAQADPNCPSDDHFWDDATVFIPDPSSERPLRRFTAWWETTPVEKFLEDIDFLLQESAFLSIINLVASITIIISLTTWLTTEKQRRYAEVYQAWQVITAAYEQPGSGGRKEALEFLNSEPRRFPLFWLRWEKQNLASLAAPKVFLRGINLEKAKLWQANLQQAELEKANLQQADLWGANLQQANLSEVENLISKQIKSACFWKKAIYKSTFNRKKHTWEVDKDDNEDFIKQLQEDTSSDPEKAVDCSIWRK